MEMRLDTETPKPEVTRFQRDCNSRDERAHLS